ncbi:MAG: hypothetical protein EBU08_15950 [Micrococcales bacterium]|jgi:hypothetical protein|nr:hypothetical protein [Micrococcales bacterium]
MDFLSNLEELLKKTSDGPWSIRQEGQEICIVNKNGDDVSGLAQEDARPDYEFIVESRNKLPELIKYHNRLIDMLFQHRVCLDCGSKMNRQLYCIKCDVEWQS